MARILTVDDSASMRKMLRVTLQTAGHDVTEAADGSEALEVARINAFELVISDVNMPGMDGLTLIGELRSLPDFKYTPILMLTTEVAKQKKQIAKEAGATGWILKPFDPTRLVDTVTRVLG